MTPTELSKARDELAATFIGDYALFGGGRETSDRSSVVDAYNSNLTRSTPTALSVARSELAATTAGNYALFGGGGNSETVGITVDAYDRTLTRSYPAGLTSPRKDLVAAAVSNYAIFAGGQNPSSYACSAAAEVYKVNDISEVTVFKGSKYKFQNMSEEVEVTSDIGTITIPAPATGYVKFKNATL